MGSSGREDITYVLVTGANTGVGFGTCKRILTTFLTTRPAAQRIHLVASTRSTAKSDATLQKLQKALQASPRLKAAADARATLSSVEMDLLQLPTVIAAAAKLNKELPRLDVIVCNAGIYGPQVMNAALALYHVCLHPVQALTWPRFGVGRAGLKAPKQLPRDKPEPVLGQIFTANVFGHYMLVHRLASLLAGDDTSRPPGRIIFVSSLDADGPLFRLDDMQCLKTRWAYDSSKRLTDLLVLNAEQPEAAESVRSFFSDANGTAIPLPRRPTIYLSHPSVAGTDIYPVGAIGGFMRNLSFYFVRLLGSPWHTIWPETAANAATWLALTPDSTLQGLEERDGKGKWGSATDRWGAELVLRTEVNGYGWGGKVGEELRYAPGRKGRSNRAVDVTNEARAKFDQLGVDAWREMEALRMEWDALLQDAK